MYLSSSHQEHPHDDLCQLFFYFHFFLLYRPDSAQRKPCGQSSPVAARRLTRPSSVTHNLSDIGSGRRASTSSNDSASSLSSASLAPTLDSKCDSLGSSEHSSLSSHHSLSHLHVPDRNNNSIKGLPNGSPKPSTVPQAKSAPTKKRLLQPAVNDVNMSRIPKSKASPVGQSRQYQYHPPPRTLTPAHKLKSSSSLAIPHLTSMSSKIPCLDSTNKLRQKNASQLSIRYSTNNLYLASQTPEKTIRRIPLVTPNGTGSKPPPNRSTNLTRVKQKSSVDVKNLSHENYFSLSQIETALDQVPNESHKMMQYQQHRRHYSSSSLPRAAKSAHSSPYAKRREFPNQVNCATNGDHNGDTGVKLEHTKRFQGSATSLNSTASTVSGSSSSLSTNAAYNSRENVNQQTEARRTLPVGPKPTMKADKRPSALVEVCSWLERNHVAPT